MKRKRKAPMPRWILWDRQMQARLDQAVERIVQLMHDMEMIAVALGNIEAKHRKPRSKARSAADIEAAAQQAATDIAGNGSAAAAAGERGDVQ